MKRVVFFGLFALSVFLASCSGDRPVKFPETVTVVTRQLDFDSVYMKYPYRVRLSGSTLYVMDLHPREFYCHAFRYPSMQFIRSFAHKGKAPDELSSIGNIAVGEDEKVYILNSYGRKMYTYDLEDGHINPLTELPEEMLFYFDFELYNDSTFIFSDFYGKTRLFLVDRNGNITRTVGSIPAKENAGNIPEAALGSAWRAYVGYNPRNGIAALATQFGEVLEIYNLRDNSNRTVVGMGGKPKCSFKGNSAAPIGILGYSDIFVGDKHIYALFWGHPYEKILNGEITVEGGSYIHVFDLKGNPVRRYELDQHITGFTVNEATGELIGTDVDNENLIVFNL